MTDTLRVAIVDDEKPARERLEHLVRRDRRLELVRSCRGGAEAIEVLRQASAGGVPVQVLLLDVQMPEVNGFAVAADVLAAHGPESMPAIVFVTAFDQYALRAFDAQAIDYLLKPFSDERFQAAIDRAVRHARSGRAHALVSQLHALIGGSPPATTISTEPARPVIDRLVVKGSDRVRLLPVDQIAWIEADGMYVKLHTRDGKAHLHRELLGALDETLDPRGFVRIHRSAIVNIDLVEELRQDAHGDYVARLRDGTSIRVGRGFRARLAARLGQKL